MKKEFQLKHCNKCGIKKHMTEFHSFKLAIDGLSSNCKVCNNHRARQWSLNNPDKRKNAQLKKLYGIDLKTYQDMYKAQNQKCAICKGKNKVKSITLSLAVDHDHSTNLVRGLLCSPCNQALGLLNENPEIFQNAISYIQLFKKT